MICPSDNPYDIYNESNNRIVSRTYISHDAQGPGIGIGYFNVSDFGGDQPGLTSYLGVAGNAGFSGDTSANNWDQWVGVFNSCSKVSLPAITSADGTSNVLMFGEIPGVTHENDDPNTRYAFTWIGNGLCWNNYGLPGNNRVFAFGSKHSGVTNFVHCDGSVHSIRTPTTSPGEQYNAYIYLSGYKDGRTFDASSIN